MQDYFFFSSRLVLTNQFELRRIRLKLLLHNLGQKTVGTFSLLMFLVFYYISSREFINLRDKNIINKNKGNQFVFLTWATFAVKQ